jgi:hypothetical protein
MYFKRVHENKIRGKLLSEGIAVRYGIMLAWQVLSHLITPPALFALVIFEIEFCFTGGQAWMVIFLQFPNSLDYMTVLRLRWDLTNSYYLQASFQLGFFQFPSPK